MERGFSRMQRIVTDYLKPLCVTVSRLAGFRVFFIREDPFDPRHPRSIAFPVFS